MSKRVKFIITYLAVVIALLLVRIGFREDFFGDLTDEGVDTLFPILAQVFCMGIIPLMGIALSADKGEGFYPLRDRLYIKPVKGKKVWLVCIVIAVLHIVINSGVSTVWHSIVKLTGYTSVVSDPDKIYTVGALLLAILLHAVFPAVFEEITHRGLCMSACRGSDHKRVLFTALLFGLMHQNIMQTGYTLVCGVVMGYLVVYTGSILPAMLTHFLNNALVQLRIFSYTTGGFIASCYDWIYSLMDSWWGMAILTAFWIICTVATVYLLDYLRKKRDESGVTLPSVVVSAGKKEKTLSFFLWYAVIAVGVVATAYTYIAGLMR